MTVEVQTKYITTVSELPEAWQFIFSKLDTLGPDIDVRVQTTWAIPMQDALEGREGDWYREYVVTVKGVTEEEE